MVSDGKHEERIPTIDCVTDVYARGVNVNLTPLTSKRGALATDARGCSLWRSLLECPPPAWESRVRDPLGTRYEFGLCGPGRGCYIGAVTRMGVRFRGVNVTDVYARGVNVNLTPLTSKRGALATDARGCSLWRSLLERPPPVWESRVRDPLGTRYEFGLCGPGRGCYNCKNHGRSVRDVTRRFLKSIVLSSKWAETAIAILAACHSQIFESGQKGGMDVGCGRRPRWRLE